MLRANVEWWGAGARTTDRVGGREPEAGSMRTDGRHFPGRTPGSASGGAVRRGSSTVDYVLILGVVFPLAAFALPAGKRIVGLVYEMFAVLVSWPFM